MRPCKVAHKYPDRWYKRQSMYTNESYTSWKGVRRVWEREEDCWNRIDFPKSLLYWMFACQMKMEKPHNSISFYYKFTRYFPRNLTPEHPNPMTKIILYSNSYISLALTLTLSGFLEINSNYKKDRRRASIIMSTIECVTCSYFPFQITPFEDFPEYINNERDFFFL